jgi:predicted HD phosphohydrolase
MRFSTVEEIIDLYAAWGGEHYSESVTQTAHAVQCANLAALHGAPAHLVVAALLHDIGHLIDLATNDGREIHDRDTSHEATGSRSLADMFPVAVRSPIALHVEAKRWLCARRPGYAEALSPASARSLTLQGGPMNDVDAARFEALPGFADAVALREWDDEGKNERLEGGIDVFEAILRESAAALVTRR